MIYNASDMNANITQTVGPAWGLWNTSSAFRNAKARA